MKFVKIFFLLALILFPFGELLRFQITNHVAIKPIDVVVGITAMIWVASQLRPKSKVKSPKLMGKFKRFQKHSLLFPLSLFILIGFISLVINLIWLRGSEFLVSLLYLLRFVSYLALLPIVMQFDNAFKKTISKVLLVDGLIILLLGYLQYFFYNSLKSVYHLGWDEHMHRMVSTFFDPNFVGAFFVLYLLFVGGIFFKYQIVSIKYKVYLGLLLFLVLIALFLTFSRASLLMFLVSMVVFFLLINKKRFIALGIALLILFGIVVSPKFYDENMNLFRIASSNARLENYGVALQVIEDHPIIGVGFNSYRYTKDLYGLNHDWVDAPSHADAGVDNSWLFVLATTGILGFAGYSWFWVRVIRSLLKLKRSVVVAAMIAGIVGLFIHALFINSLFFTPLLFWIWIVLGLRLDSSVSSR